MMQMAVFSGSSVGPYIGGVLVDSFGYRHSFFLTGIMLALGGFVVLFWVTERFVPKAVVPGAARGSIFRDLVETVRDPKIAALIGVLALVQFGSIVVAPILPLFIQALVGSRENVATVAGQIFGVAGIAGAVSSVVIGRVSDRVGYRAILIWATVIAGIIQTAMAFVDSADQLLVLRAIVGLFMGGMLPTANALIAQAVAPDRRGAAFGAAASIASAGAALGPIVGSAIAATAGLRAVFPVTGIIFVAAGVALVFFQLESGDQRVATP